jgi:hypothetical protein
MRLKDLNTTTEYAYRTSKYHTPRKILVLDATQLYISSRRRSSDSTPVPARKGARATTGTGYYEPTIGVLFREASTPTGQPALAMPQHIISTWAEWETTNAAEQEFKRKQDAARKVKENENASNAARIKELLAAHPEITGVYASQYQNRTEVPYPVLIRLLEALPDADS